MRLVVASIALVLGLVLFPSRAEAYPWMVRHGYTQCANCHTDPAGGGLLNPYGRAQGEILMRMRYGAPPDREPSTFAEPIWGLLSPPDGLLVGGAVRSAYVRRMPLSGDAQARFIVMQADALGQYKLWRFRANASVGYVHEGANAAAVTRGFDDKVVSRVHWVGMDIGSRDELLVRAGRMNVPYGLRSIEHTMFTRMETRSDINAAQQHGLSLDFHRGPLRASLMGVAGNYQVEQDRFRSRGYAGLVEYAFKPTFALGVSSMALNTKLDLALLTPTWRQAHGLFVRYSPIRLAVMNAQWDFLHTSQPTPGQTFFGGVGMFSVDLEPMQGLHLGPTFEVLARDFDQGGAALGAWASVWWFFLPHADVRFDAIGNKTPTPAGSVQGLTAVLQLHVYL